MKVWFNTNRQLIMACREGNRIKVFLLLYVKFLKVDINTKDQYGESVLSIAIGKKHNKIAKMLVENGANVNATNHRGMSALYWALMSGQTDIAKLLIAKGADIKVIDKSNETALDLAIKYDYDEIIDLLAQKGYGIHNKNNTWVRLKSARYPQPSSSL